MIKKVINKLNLLAEKQYAIPLVLFLGTLVIYIRNLSPSVYGGDSGDILAAAITWGVPHPSGYPLITFLGALFVKFLPFGETPAWRFGFLSALLSSMSVVLIYFSSKYLTKERTLSFATALTLAFAFPFWLYAEIAEVIALHNFFITLLIYLGLRYISSPNNKNLYIIALVAGLSLTNNLTILLLFPALALAVLTSSPKAILNIKTILKVICLFILGLTPYLYIPIAALRFPQVNTGFAVNLKNFWYLASRHYYGWGNAHPSEFDSQITKINFEAFITYAFIYLKITVMILFIFGLVKLAIDKKYKILTFLVAALFFLTLFFIFYSRVQFVSIGNRAVVEKFYAQTIIVPILLLPLAIQFFVGMIKKYFKNPFLKNIASWSFFAILIIQPISYFRSNIDRLDLSNITIGDNFGRDVLNTADLESMVLPLDDSMGYVSLYYMTAFKYRTDIKLPGLHDGLDYILRSMNLDEEEIVQYKINSRGVVDSRITLGVIPLIMQNRSVYAAYPVPDMQFKDKKVTGVPFGLLEKLEFTDGFKLTKEEYLSRVNTVVSSYQIEDLLNNSSKISDQLYLSHIRKGYALAMFRIGDFVRTYYDDAESAKKYYDLGNKLTPEAYN